MQKYTCLVVIVLWLSVPATAQVPDKIYDVNIHNVKLNYSGNQLAYPIIKLNGADRLDLNFDDLNGGVRSYSYTWQLCNADWNKTILSEFDYIKGFTQNRITTYRNSSIALVKYTHYMVTLPESNCLPSRSGNYLLKVFADGDTAKVVFTRRVLVVEEKSTVGAQIQQPFDGQIFQTHQKLLFTVNLGNINIINALQQVKVFILQNNRWDNALTNLKPTFIRQNSLEYNSENIVFPGGREWRWLDLRSFRLQSDRVATATYNNNSTDIFLKPDVNRAPQRLVYYKDYNGMYYNDISESVNYLWQADFADTHFSFIPDGNQELADKDVYLFGELTNYGTDDKAKMVFNKEKGVYETDLLLKNGYYNYDYVTIDKQGGPASFDFTEGNLWDTENSYTILVYFRAINGRADELIGVAHVNSLTGRSGY
ncbi:MAG: hypothetical protein NVSMB7_09950 [Chitinophagaceae bacterium]